MPNATLTFTLPDDRYEYDCARNGADYRRILQDMDHWLRTQHKYNNKPWADVARDQLWQIIHDHGVDDIHGE